MADPRHSVDFGMKPGEIFGRILGGGFQRYLKDRESRTQQQGALNRIEQAGNMQLRNQEQLRGGEWKREDRKASDVKAEARETIDGLLESVNKGAYGDLTTTAQTLLTNTNPNDPAQVKQTAAALNDMLVALGKMDVRKASDAEERTRLGGVLEEAGVQQPNRSMAVEGVSMNYFPQTKTGSGVEGGTGYLELQSKARKDADSALKGKNYSSEFKDKAVEIGVNRLISGQKLKWGEIANEVDQANPGLASKRDPASEDDVNQIYADAIKGKYSPLINGAISAHGLGGAIVNSNITDPVLIDKYASAFTGEMANMKTNPEDYSSNPTDWNKPAYANAKRAMDEVVLDELMREATHSGPIDEGMQMLPGIPPDVRGILNQLAKRGNKMIGMVPAFVNPNVANMVSSNAGLETIFDEGVAGSSTRMSLDDLLRKMIDQGWGHGDMEKWFTSAFAERGTRYADHFAINPETGSLDLIRKQSYGESAQKIRSRTGILGSGGPQL